MWVLSLAATFGARANAAKPAAIIARLQAACRAAVAHAPSLLLLDDLDAWLPAAPAGAAGGDGAARMWLGESAAALLSSLAHSGAAVTVVASAASEVALHPALTTDGLIDSTIRLAPPDRRGRATLPVPCRAGGGGVDGGVGGACDFAALPTDTPLPLPNQPDKVK